MESSESVTLCACLRRIGNRSYRSTCGHNLCSRCAQKGYEGGGYNFNNLAREGEGDYDNRFEGEYFDEYTPMCLVGTCPSCSHGEQYHPLAWDAREIIVYEYHRHGHNLILRETREEGETNPVSLISRVANTMHEMNIAYENARDGTHYSQYGFVFKLVLSGGKVIPFDLSMLWRMYHGSSMHRVERPRGERPRSIFHSSPLQMTPPAISPHGVPGLTTPAISPHGVPGLTTPLTGAPRLTMPWECYSKESDRFHRTISAIYAKQDGGGRDPSERDRQIYLHEQTVLRSLQEIRRQEEAYEAIRRRRQDINRYIDLLRQGYEHSVDTLFASTEGSVLPESLRTLISGFILKRYECR